MKMPGPNDVITIKANQLNKLACESNSLAHADHFGNKAA
jgi:hypothetical protein